MNSLTGLLALLATLLSLYLGLPSRSGDLSAAPATKGGRFTGTGDHGES